MYEYRELTVTINESDGIVPAGDVMRDVLLLSSREVSRCKQFEDGVMVIRKSDNAENDKKIIKAIPIRLIDRLSPGDVLIVRIYEDNDNAGDIVPVQGEIEIVYEDEDLIALNKKGDMVVHPSYAHYTDSLSNYLSGYYERTGQNHVIRTIGRLDRETSGIVIFAKNRHSAALLSKQTIELSRRKEYLAICHGVFEENSGTVDAPIRRRPSERMIREVHPEGKRAITHFTVEKQYEDYALVRLKLDTGRTHQIRVHMSYLGHPLLGDNFYGYKSDLLKIDKELSVPFDNHGMTRAALHAARVEFQQPITGDKITLCAELPEDMRRLL